MTGAAGHMGRAYLDWNASAPLCADARDAMLRAMEEAGNPSSVHAEGRKAKAIVERARAQVAALADVEPSEVIFTSGATESAAMAVASRPWQRILTSQVEHDAVSAAISRTGAEVYHLGTTASGAIALDDVGEHVQAVEELDEDPWLLPTTSGPLYGKEPSLLETKEDLICLQAANGETGVYHQLDKHLDHGGYAVTSICDLTQIAGRPIRSRDDREARRDPLGEHAREHVYTYGVLSAHKMGGPKGVGALIARGGAEIAPMIAGGGQELGRRSGTENVAAIAGFGAAAEAAKRQLENGVWDEVAARRNKLEAALEDAAPDLLIMGRDAPRLPNTTCFAIAGWKGETQVMQMDLAGFAVSAGSACSSGKVNRASKVLLAAGYDEITASSAIRVSIGPTTTGAELDSFASAWISAYRRWKAKAA